MGKVLKSDEILKKESHLCCKFRLIGISFLSEEMKDYFIVLLKNRINRLELYG